MFNTQLTRLASLLLTLGLICGFITTGCGEKDRDPSDAPSASKVIYYKFDTVAAKMDFSKAEYVSVTSVNADKEYVSAKLRETKISDMEQDGTYRIAETILANDAALAMYTFYHYDPNDSEQKLSDGYTMIRVNGVSSGTTIEADPEQEYTVSLVVKDKDGNTPDSFAVDDDVYVEVHGFYFGKDVNFSGDESATLVSSNENVLKVIVPGYDEEHNALKCQAVGEGEVSLSVICDGVLTEDLATVKVTGSRQMFYLPKGGFELSDDGYLTIASTEIQTCDQLVNLMSLGVEVEAGLPAYMDLELLYFIDNAGGRARFETGNDPADDAAEVVIQVTGGNESDFANTTYSNGVIHVKWSDQTADGEEAKVSLKADGYESQGDIVIKFVNP